LFLVRDSHTIPGAYVMSLAHNQKVKHLHITSVKHNDTVFYTVDNGSTKFHDLIQLIEFYQANQGCLPTKLTHHVTVLL
ncbi:PREDICTED: growth factor receptor-bound protein 14-like, partial [Priapulus caudatus]|uniref:Growth factor receptor-bound protein 14-like n=1 Tax=Priapulus caudatus TaxID=37621 RepID=A0ABM1EKH9_PRICU